MSRPLALIAIALMAGILTADIVFYDHLIVPAWLNIAAWGFSLLLAVGAALCWRSDGHSWSNRVLFPLLTFLFIAVVGFARYASYADDVHTAWQQMERPPVNRGNPDEFDYVRWRWIQGVEDTTAWTSKLKQHALRWRASLLQKYASAEMDDEARGIVAAVTLADRSQLNRETRDLYAAAGASHLLALSGLHLSIIIGFFLTLLSGRLVMSRWRPWLGLAVLVFIWTYAFVAGLPTSLVRASLMTSLLLIGLLIQRYGHPLHWLVLTACVMLLVRPVWLFDVGAQLSFAAVAGIVVLYKRWFFWIHARWHYLCFALERWHLMWPLDLLLVSVAAQLSTLPLVAYYFHRIPLYAPLFNLVYIPLTTVLIIVAFLLLVLASLPFAACLVPWMGRVLSWIVAAQMSVMQFEVRLPAAVIDDFWSRKAQSQVVVYNNGRCPALHVIASPDRSWLLAPQPDSLQSGLRYIEESFWRRRLTSEPQVLTGRKAIAVQEFTAVMIDHNDNTVCRPPTPSKSSPRTIDVLWITRGFKGTGLAPLSTLYAPRLLVLDASLSHAQRSVLHRQASSLGWSVWDINVQGALRMKLQAVNDK